MSNATLVDSPARRTRRRRIGAVLVPAALSAVARGVAWPNLSANNKAKLTTSVRISSVQKTIPALRSLQLEATLEGSIDRLGYTKVHAPMSGTVSALETLEGSAHGG